MLIFKMETKPMHFFKEFVLIAINYNWLLTSDTDCCRRTHAHIPGSNITVELTRRRESKHLRRIKLVAKHAPAARVQRFVRRLQSRDGWAIRVE
jgi:hypothetical protein